MSEDVPLVRLYLLRCIYLMEALVLGGSVWPDLVRHMGWSDPLQGVAPSFWATLSVLALLGVRQPLKMLPLLLVQFTYKLIWLIWIWLPLHAAGGSTGLTKAMLMGGILEPLVIPWPYLFRAFIANPGDRWMNRSQSPKPTDQDLLATNAGTQRTSGGEHGTSKEGGG